MANKKTKREKKLSTNFIILFIIGISLFVLSFIAANPTNFWSSTDATTVNYTSASSYAGQPNEDVLHEVKLTLNTTLGGSRNITVINITLPAELVLSNNSVAIGGNLTLNGTLKEVNISINYTSNGKILTWSNSSADTAVIPGSNGTQWINSTLYFNFTAYNPGTYNISVRFFYNGSGANGPYSSYNETNISIRVNDTTIPAITNESNFSDVVKFGNYSGIITLNATLADNGRIKLVIFNITNASGYHNGSMAHTALNSSTAPRDWNASWNTREVPDGIYNVTVFVTDFGGNLNNSARVYNLTIDNTAPTGALSCTPSTVNVGDAVTCSCTQETAEVLQQHIM